MMVNLLVFFLFPLNKQDLLDFQVEKYSSDQQNWEMSDFFPRAVAGRGESRHLSRDAVVSIRGETLSALMSPLSFLRF